MSAFGLEALVPSSSNLDVTAVLSDVLRTVREHLQKRRPTIEVQLVWNTARRGVPVDASSCARKDGRTYYCGRLTVLEVA